MSNRFNYASLWQDIKIIRKLNKRKKIISSKKMNSVLLPILTGVQKIILT